MLCAYARVAIVCEKVGSLTGSNTGAFTIHQSEGFVSFPALVSFNTSGTLYKTFSGYKNEQNNVGIKISIEYA